MNTWNELRREQGRCEGQNRRHSAATSPPLDCFCLAGLAFPVLLNAIRTEGKRSQFLGHKRTEEGTGAGSRGSWQRRRRHLAAVAPCDPKSSKSPCSLSLEEKGGLQLADASRSTGISVGAGAWRFALDYSEDMGRTCVPGTWAALLPIDTSSKRREGSSEPVEGQDASRVCGCHGRHENSGVFAGRGLLVCVTTDLPQDQPSQCPRLKMGTVRVNVTGSLE